MKRLFFHLFFINVFMFTGCFDDGTISKEECISQGMVYKNKKILNYRTGKYEQRYVCEKR